ncbi:hypothetical protein OH779_30310 [Actinacidiphila glaucinigra]|uniref:hypothetical protein n=1 Tax=Actinacidiphila glaucinigra TaxID=235986 RepID=UPI00386B9DDD
MSNSGDERDLFSDPDRTAPFAVRGPAPVLDPFRAAGPASAATAPAARAADGPGSGAIAPLPGAEG